MIALIQGEYFSRVRSKNLKNYTNIKFISGQRFDLRYRSS